jgi:hypothetical protein
VQRRALALLFVLIFAALVFVGIAALVGAHGAARWVIAATALALAAWMASLATGVLRRR